MSVRSLATLSVHVPVPEQPAPVQPVNDEPAAGVLFECQRRHLSVPGKLAIAGFDDLDVARACYPALTSVRIPYRKMGQEAAELILRQLAGEPVMGTALTLDFQLQKRQSS